MKRPPVHARADIPNGWQAHVGDDVWLKRCRAEGCAVTWESPHGAFPLFILEHAEHEASHGIPVPGYNVGILP